MTIRDPEVLDLLRDDPELLALADAIVETQRLPRRSWNLPRMVLLAAALAAAGLILGLIAPWRGGGNGIVDRALAAIGGSGVIHSVERTKSGQVLIQLATGRRVVEMMETETWYDPDSGRIHGVVREHGQIVYEVLGNTRDARVEIDPAFAAFPSGYREALANGSARVVGTGVVRGRPVYWLGFGGRVEVAIDRESFKPLRLRQRIGSHTIVADILVAENIPLRSADFTRHTPPSEQQRSSTGGGTGTIGPGGLSSGRGALRPPWLWAGERVAGMKLSGVQEIEFRSDSRSGRGLVLGYGAVMHGIEPNLGARYLILNESRAELEKEPLAPTGFLRVGQGESGNGKVTTDVWNATLRVRGIHVQIETSVGERAVVEAARALRLAS